MGNAGRGPLSRQEFELVTIWVEGASHNLFLDA